jgi:hypothetical protein
MTLEYLSLNIADIKRGDLFWECEGGRDALFIATSDARREKNGIGVNGREIPDGNPQHFFEHDRGGAYGPRLYNLPQYTRPDWSALLTALAKCMHEELLEADRQGAARETTLQLAATQYSESRDHWQQEARRAQTEIARLRGLVSDIQGIIGHKHNGITMAGIIQARIATVIEQVTG